MKHLELRMRAAAMAEYFFGCRHEVHQSKVVDCRSHVGGKVIRRRRACRLCGKRFTTYETIAANGNG
ncbi:MAG: hypothetical protein U0990_09610 [Candidatus Nanopelagicales bacterium]|nr:hypothetical protein [Candidatus Nanopelagicales bacterium]